MMSAAHDETHDQCEHHDAEQHAHEADIETHIAVEDVAELVRDDALQLIPVQQLERATRHGHGRVARREPGCKRVDAAFFLEHVDFRHRYTRGDGHFLDDIAQALTQWVLHVRRYESASYRARDRAAARRECGRLEHAGAEYEQGRQERRADQDA